jgi:hypothetical protein
MEEPICRRNVASPFGDGHPIRNFILFILSQLLLGLLSNCIVPAKAASPRRARARKAIRCQRTVRLTGAVIAARAVCLIAGRRGKALRPRHRAVGA